MTITNLILLILGVYLLFMALLWILALTIPNNRICPSCHRQKKWNDLGWKFPCKRCKDH